MKYEKGEMESRKFSLALFGVLLLQMNRALEWINGENFVWGLCLLIGGYLGINTAQKILPAFGRGSGGAVNNIASQPQSEGWPAGAID